MIKAVAQHVMMVIIFQEQLACLVTHLVSLAVEVQPVVRTVYLDISSMVLTVLHVQEIVKIAPVVVCAQVAEKDLWSQLITLVEDVQDHVQVAKLATSQHVLHVLNISNCPQDPASHVQADARDVVEEYVQNVIEVSMYQSQVLPAYPIASFLARIAKTISRQPAQHAIKDLY